MSTPFQTSQNQGQAIKSDLSIGDSAPDFTLPDQNRDQFHLAENLGKSEIVLYFYPKDFSQGCTKEACAFRDQFESFAQVGAKVVGVSGDTVASHQYFAARYNLPFTLLADPHDAVRKLYGIHRTLGLVGGRVTFVIDKQGIIRHVFNSRGNIDGHVTEALRVLQEIQQESH